MGPDMYQLLLGTTDQARALVRAMKIVKAAKTREEALSKLDDEVQKKQDIMRELPVEGNPRKFNDLCDEIDDLREQSLDILLGRKPLDEVGYSYGSKEFGPDIPDEDIPF